ncbi:hypothetical protein BU15DRAFT_53028 [Melanogaster broomeanus]|nr:hypothetical protein BU15DRAFT_53028 [Melanogaster broomeanus]
MNTARLKRKLGDLGVNTSSKKANENFCLIGTPLPPLEKSKDTGEFVPLWKQEVRDEKGRRRLHGAFTGGFSAGYFNTVGSKEGWAPSTFVSSRADRAKARATRPEDFMDEEDLAELRANQTLVSEHDEMDILGGTQAERDRRVGVDDSQKDPITLALEQATFPAPKDSVGARILKKMGWKLGQGIGPRVTWRQREMQYGRDPSRTSPEVDEEAKKHTYPPRDTPVITVERKDNFHGLGYNKAIGLHASLGTTEENVYDHATSHGRSRHAFDANDMHDEEHVVIGGRHRGNKPSPATAQAPSESRQAIGRGMFRDGRPPIAGFILSDKPVQEDMWFPLSEIPKGWTPNPKGVWEREKATGGDKENVARFPLPSEPQSYAQWKTGISADQRGAALGETPLPSVPRSVFEYMSQKDQERIKNVAASHLSAPTTTTTDIAEQPGITAPQQSFIPHTEPHVAQAALRGFQPFTSDPAKQARYNAYLHAHVEPGSGVSLPPRMPTQTPETYAREMSEFAKAAALFRPVSGAMAGRFTSATVLDLGPNIVEGLRTASAEQVPETATEPNDEENKEEVKEEDPKVYAARLGMYGLMTREVTPWQPARLLCKRFGVKDPDPEIHVETHEASTSAAASQSTDFAADAGGAVGGEIPSADVPTGLSGPSGKRDLANIGLGEDDGQGDDILTYERPSMDIFKAIFASDDEGSDDESNDKAREDEVDVPIPPQPPSPVAAQTTAADSAKAVAVVAEEVDLSTFKPTFIPRDTQPKSANGKASAPKEKKVKKPKGGALVSFDLDEGGGESLLISARRENKERDRPKKKRKKQKEEEEEVWVEKPAPDIVKELPPAADTPHDDDVQMDDSGGHGVVGPPRGRKRAIDFM